MRLTEKETVEMFDNVSHYYSTEKHWEAINKLGQLEDIEEKLGIDLLELLSDGEFQNLMYSYAHNVPFVFAPRKEEKK